MSKKKQTAPKKLKSKKLEDRIAPGMVGSGIVDPGMADSAHHDGGPDQPSSSGEISGTQIEQSPYLDSGDHDSSHFGDDRADTSSLEHNGNNYDNDEFENSQSDDHHHDSDEFAQQDQSQYTPPAYGDYQVTWSEADWVTSNADGTYSITPPEGVTIDSESGLANFPIEQANECLPIPESVSIQPDGGLNVSLPEGSNYLSASHSLILPEDSVDVKDIPQDFSAYTNPDGTLTVNLPEDGVTYDADTNSVSLNNYWANELSPDNIEIQNDGSVNVALPAEGVEYNADGSIDLNPEATQLMDNPAPEYVQDIDFAQMNGDGSVTFAPPEGIDVDGGIVSIPNDMLDGQVPLPEEMTINPNGTADILLPEGTTYNPDVHSLTFTEGAVNLDQVPEQIDAHANPDGSITCMLPQGIEYNADQGALHLDNYWTNEVLPDQMQVTSEGDLQVALPEGTSYFEDGSFTIPSEYSNFTEYPAPDYIHDVSFSEYQPGGSYHFTPPSSFDVDPTEGIVQIPYQSLYEIPMDPNLNIHADGTMDVTLPDNVQYTPHDNSLYFPVGSLSIDQIPAEVNPVLNNDGSISVTLPSGMEYNADSNSVHVDNYWTNELTPAPISVSTDGTFSVNLPQNTEFHQDGSFTVPHYESNFLEYPQPDYVTHGPEWMNMNPDGSVSLTVDQHVQINPTEGTLNMSVDYMNNNFGNYYDSNIQFQSDGTMDIKIPEGTAFNSVANTLTLPEGSVNMNHIPPYVSPIYQPDGSITVHLQQGMNFDTETNTVNMNNYWTNMVTPEPVQIDPNGMVSVDLPHNTHYFEDGHCSIPSEASNFIETPYPSYINHGPDWTVDNADGSVSVTPPQGAIVDPNTGTMTMNYNLATEHFGDMMEHHDFQIQPDGSAQIGVPEGTQFSPSTNSLTFPSGTLHHQDLPPTVQYQYQPGGALSVTLPQGVSYNSDAGVVQCSNQWVNQMTPEPMHVTPTGGIVVQLPPDTQYFPNSGFTITNHSADFLQPQTPPISQPDLNHNSNQPFNSQTTSMNKAA